jgi:UDP-4-amino-4,6-dideoxy-N-acetyl-beta-L-altrosamine transaminase
MKPIPYGRQDITEADLAAVREALLSDFLTQGPRIAEFERAFASYIGCRHAVAVANGTVALHLAALALGTKLGTRVITTPITFVASANCVRYCGGDVYFADIDPSTYLIDLAAVERLIHSKPKGYFHGIIPVDFAGRAVNPLELSRLAKEHGLWVLEDACHSPGGWYAGEGDAKHRCGGCEHADAAIFSFHPVKHIACGEGGMITTNSDEVHQSLLLLRTHGITRDPARLVENHGGWYYEMQQLGFNYRITDFQAALGASQLARADAGMARRRDIAARYAAAFSGNPRVLGQSGLVKGHAYHLYVIEVDDRKSLYDFLRANGVYSQVHYIPVHTMPYYRSLGSKLGDMPHSERYYSRCLSLPMFPALTDSEQERVIDLVSQWSRA